MLYHHPLDTLYQGTKQLSEGIGQMAMHPVRATGGPEFAEDIANKNYAGAAGTITGDVLPFLLGSPEVREGAAALPGKVADAAGTARDVVGRTLREPGRFKVNSAPGSPPTPGPLKPIVKALSGPDVLGLEKVANAVIPAHPEPIDPRMGANERIGKLKPWATPAPPPELGSPENPGWVAKLPDRMPVGKSAPTPVDPVLQAVREGRAAKLPTRMPVGKTEPAPKPSMVAGTPTNAPSTFTAPLPETEPIGKTATTSSAAPTAEAIPPTVKTAAEARAAARPELIKGSIANPSGRLILTPEEAATEARMLEIAKTRAQQHGLQYAAGMRPAGGGRVPATPTSVTIGNRGMQLNEPIGKTAARIFTSEGTEAPTTQASAPAAPKAPAERTPLTEAQRNEIQGQIKNLNTRMRALRDKQSNARVWTKANEYMRSEQELGRQKDALQRSLEEDRPVKPQVELKGMTKDEQLSTYNAAEPNLKQAVDELAELYPKLEAGEKGGFERDYGMNSALVKGLPLKEKLARFLKEHPEQIREPGDEPIEEESTVGAKQAEPIGKTATLPTEDELSEAIRASGQDPLFADNRARQLLDAAAGKEGYSGPERRSAPTLIKNYMGRERRGVGKTK